MERKVGTISRGIRCPIIREGDNLVNIVVESVLEAANSEGFSIRNRDVIGITESIVARAQGNYATIDAMAKDIKAKIKGDTVGVIFPILSRNRFAICLKAIAMAAKKVVLMLSYPRDEVGNALLTYDQLDEAGVNPYSDVLSLEKYRELFGENKHEFTGVDYVEYYSQVKPYSILEYAYNKLDKTEATPTDDEKLITLINAMLEFGGASQVYNNYALDRLANEEYAYVRIENATFSDGFNYGIYKVGTTEIITPNDGYFLSDNHAEYISTDENGQIILTIPSEKTIDTTSFIKKSIP